MSRRERAEWERRKDDKRKEAAFLQALRDKHGKEEGKKIIIKCTDQSKFNIEGAHEAMRELQISPDKFVKVERDQF